MSDDDARRVRPGQVWCHWKDGALYFVSAVSRYAKTGEELVTYRRTDGREYRTEPLATFVGEAQPGTKRFKRVR